MIFNPKLAARFSETADELVAALPQTPSAPPSVLAPPAATTAAAFSPPLGLSDELIALLKQAQEHKASDVHIVSNNVVKFRIHGQLEAFGERVLQASEVAAMFLPLLNTLQRKALEEQKDVDLSLQPFANLRLRLNVHYEKGGMAAAIRLLNFNIPSFEELNLPDKLKEIVKKNHGLIIVSGPTGHGKSTTLAALIDYINREQARHIITVEDPVEYFHVSKKSVVEQRELNTTTPSFASALKHALRQDPDVILVGEMRDLETIALAVTAAETGHLVLSTLHTNDAPQSIDRLIDVFPPHQQEQIRQQLSMSLLAIISQLLVAREDQPGRIPVLEILKSDNGIRNLIRKGRTHEIYGLMETGKASGNVTRDESLLQLVKKGILTANTALDLSRFSDLLTDALKAERLIK